MMFLLLIAGLFLFMFHGLGFLLLNGVLLIGLEILGVLFSGILGFILLGLCIKLLIVRR